MMPVIVVIVLFLVSQCHTQHLVVEEVEASPSSPSQSPSTPTSTSDNGRFNTWTPTTMEFLSPLIDTFKEDEARILSQVPFMPKSMVRVDSYSGLITINETLNSHVFFWFFKHENESAPIILWLGSNPSTSVLNDIFNGNGPFTMRSDGTVEPSESSPWTDVASILYVDPVGVGFSFSQDEEGISKSSKESAENTFNFLISWFNMFPELRGNEVFIGASMFTAPTAIHLAHIITSLGFKKSINLNGLLMWTPWLLPPLQVQFYHDFFTQNGLFNLKERESFLQREDDLVTSFTKGLLNESYFKWDKLIMGDVDMNEETLCQKYSGIPCRESMETGDVDRDLFKMYITLEEVRRVMHVGEIPFRSRSPRVMKHRADDWMTPVHRELGHLLQSGIRVLTMYGNECPLIPPASVTLSLNQVSWLCQQDLIDAPKDIGMWDVDGIHVVAHHITACNLAMVMVRGTGCDPFESFPEVPFSLVKTFMAFKPRPTSS